MSKQCLMLTFVIPILFIQSCGSITNSGVRFSKEPSVQERFGDIDCLTFSDKKQETDCKDTTYGLLGSLFYLQDRTDGAVRPETLFNRFDEEVPFNASHITSVNVILETGYEADYKVLVPEVFFPSQIFSDGFQIDESTYLTDHNDQVLVEAFAMDLKGRLQLAGQQPGHYLFGVISDDGSILDLDVDGDGTFETLIDNDEYHSPQLKCSVTPVKIGSNSKMNMRLRYFQGPRNVIALTLLMKKVDPNHFSEDELCGQRDAQNGFQFFGEYPSPGYQPDLVNSPFGDLLSRGWFVPTAGMFLLPLEL